MPATGKKSARFIEFRALGISDENENNLFFEFPRFLSVTQLNRTPTEIAEKSENFICLDKSLFFKFIARDGDRHVAFPEIGGNIIRFQCLDNFVDDFLTLVIKYERIDRF